MIIEHRAAAHLDKRGIAHQRRDPPAKQGIGRADMRIERLHRQQIADHRDLHVDHEHERDRDIADRDRVTGDMHEIGLHLFHEAKRNDRQHESDEKAFHRPGAQMVAHFGGIIGFAPDQHRTEMPGPVARIDQHTVEPQHIRDRAEKQHRRRIAHQIHRKQIIAAPVPAAQAIDEGDQRPRRPQPGDLGDRDIDTIAQTTRLGPVDPGRGPQMDFVDQKRPADHRHARRNQRGERGIRPAQRRMRPRQSHGIGDGAPIAADQQPADQPDQPRQPDACGNIAIGTRRTIGGGRGRVSHDAPPITAVPEEMVKLRPEPPSAQR